MQFLQSASASSASSAASITATLNSQALTPGSLIVAVNFTDQSSQGYTVTDPTNAGNYPAALQFNNSGQWLNVNYFANNQSNASSLAIKLATTGANFVYSMLIVAEFSGMATSSVVDQTNTGTSGSGSTSVTTGNVTTTSTNELLIGAVLTTTGTGGAPTAGSGYAIPTNGNVRPGTQTLTLEYQFVNATGTYNASLSWPSSVTGASGGIVTFIGTGAGGPVPNLLYHRKNVLYFI